MKTLTPAIAARVALIVSPAAPAAAAPTGGQVMACTRSGHVTLSPGLTAQAARDFTFTERGEFSNCRTPDGQVLSTKFAHPLGTGSGTCGSATVLVPQTTLHWSNGQSSTITAEGTTYGALAVVTGKVLDGQFAGALLDLTAFLAPADPASCFGGGLTETDYHGEVRFAFPS